MSGTAFPELAMAIQMAPIAVPIWAYFPELEDWRYVTQHLLPNGAAIWSSDHGLVLTHEGPTMYRAVNHEVHKWLH